MNVHQCKRPIVVNMDHTAGYYPDLRPMVNRMCLTCGTHWYGNAEAAVFEIPRHVWGAWMETALSDCPVSANSGRACSNCRHFVNSHCHAGEFEDYAAFPLPVNDNDVCECHEYQTAREAAAA